VAGAGGRERGVGGCPGQGTGACGGGAERVQAALQGRQRRLLRLCGSRRPAPACEGAGGPPRVSSPFCAPLPPRGRPRTCQEGHKQRQHPADGHCARRAWRRGGDTAAAGGAAGELRLRVGAVASAAPARHTRGRAAALGRRNAAQYAVWWAAAVPGASREGGSVVGALSPAAGARPGPRAPRRRVYMESERGPVRLRPRRGGPAPPAPLRSNAPFSCCATGLRVRGARRDGNKELGANAIGGAAGRAAHQAFQRRCGGGGGATATGAGDAKRCRQLGRWSGPARPIHECARFARNHHLASAVAAQLARRRPGGGGPQGARARAAPSRPQGAKPPGANPPTRQARGRAPFFKPSAAAHGAGARTTTAPRCRAGTGPVLRHWAQGARPPRPPVICGSARRPPARNGVFKRYSARWLRPGARGAGRPGARGAGGAGACAAASSCEGSVPARARARDGGAGGPRRPWPPAVCSLSSALGLFAAAAARGAVRARGGACAAPPPQGGRVVVRVGRRRAGARAGPAPGAKRGWGRLQPAAASGAAAARRSGRGRDCATIPAPAPCPCRDRAPAGPSRRPARAAHTLFATLSFLLDRACPSPTRLAEPFAPGRAPFPPGPRCGPPQPPRCDT
jgi:hypothetical protein